MDEILAKLDRTYTKLQELQLAPTVHNSSILVIAYQDLKDAYAFVKDLKIKQEQAELAAEEAKREQAAKETAEVQEEAVKDE